MTVRIIQGDAIEVMKTLPDQSVDLIACDPPYAVTQNHWDQIIPFEPMWREVWRLCRGAAVFTAMQPFSSLLVVSQIEQFRHEWVWEKNKATGHLNAKKSPMRAHELALVFSQKQPPYYPQITTGHARKTAVQVNARQSSNYGEASNKPPYDSTERYPRTVQQFAVVNNDDPEKVHPTQKPVDLFEYLIKTYSREGDTILDFACGSGTTGVACRHAKRHFIGIDNNAEYVALAEKRIANFAGPLFAGVE